MPTSSEICLWEGHKSKDALVERRLDLLNARAENHTGMPWIFRRSSVIPSDPSYSMRSYYLCRTTPNH